MKIEQMKITVGQVCEGWKNDAEEGVSGFGGLLDVRPKYQREFVYKDKQRDAVVRTVRQGFPLNVLYWCRVRKEDGIDGWEVLDGQQRTISICEYVAGSFSVDNRYFHNLSADERQKILDYQLLVYGCEGGDEEKLDWFRVVNIAGERLTEQELLNAVYAGPWLADAKRWFSRTNCPATMLASHLLKGVPIRQEVLETVFLWAARAEGIEGAEGDAIREFMARHQNDADAKPLWEWFRGCVKWVEKTFYVQRREMKGLPWGIFYLQHGKRKLDPDQLEKEIQRLMADDDVTRKSGVYEYLLTGEERVLSIRAFDKSMARAAWERQKHACASCGAVLPFERMQADHDIPWSKGGRTVSENCKMLCAACNRKKGAQQA